MTLRHLSVERTAFAPAMSGSGGGALRRLKKRIVKEGWATDPGWRPKPGFLYTQVRAIAARINQNWDGWPADELKKSYRTFVGKPCFVNHENFDPKLARGVVVASRYVENGPDKFIEVIQEIDSKRFPKLAHEIVTGGLDSVSMGAEAAFTICSYCHKKAEEDWDLCDHVKYHKGEKLARFNPKTGKTDRVLVYESCHKLGFFELSYVFDPADETAVASRVIAASKTAGNPCPPGVQCDDYPDAVSTSNLDPGTAGTTDSASGNAGDLSAPSATGPAAPSASGERSSSGLLPGTQALNDMLLKEFPGADIGGVRDDPAYPDEHPAGKALDFMTTDADQQARVREIGLQNGADYAISNGQMWYPDGRTEPYNGPNPHTDHVHLHHPGGVQPTTKAASRTAGASDDYWEWKRLVESGEIEPEHEHVIPRSPDRLRNWSERSRRRDANFEERVLMTAGLEPSFEDRVLRVAWGQAEAPAKVDTLREEGSAPEDDNDDEHHYVEPPEEKEFDGYIDSPEEFQDPDLSAAGQLDREQGQGFGQQVPQPAEPQYMTLKIPMPVPTPMQPTPQIPTQAFAPRPPPQPQQVPMQPQQQAPQQQAPMQMAAVRVPREVIAYFDRYYGLKVAAPPGDDELADYITNNIVPNAPNAPGKQDLNPGAPAVPAGTRGTLTQNPMAAGAAATDPMAAGAAAATNKGGAPNLEDWQTPGGTNPTDKSGPGGKGLAMPFAQSQVGQYSKVLDRDVAAGDVTDQANQDRIKAWDTANPGNVFDPNMKYDPNTMQRGVQHSFTKPGPGAPGAPPPPPGAPPPPGGPIGAGLTAPGSTDHLHHPTPAPGAPPPPGVPLGVGAQLTGNPPGPPPTGAPPPPPVAAPPAGPAPNPSGVNDATVRPASRSFKDRVLLTAGFDALGNTPQRPRTDDGLRTKGPTMGRSTLADRGRTASRGRQQHFAGGPYSDSGDRHRNDQGEQEEAFISETPREEPVGAPTGDGHKYPNSEENLVQRVQAGRRQLLRDAKALAAHRALYGGPQPGEHASEVNPDLSGTDDQSLKGDFQSANPDEGHRPSNPHDASLNAFKHFDNWLGRVTGRTARDHGSRNIRLAADEWARQHTADVRVLFPALGIVLRQARKNEVALAARKQKSRKGAQMRKQAVDLPAAAPDDRVSVEKPVKGTTDLDAQASQFKERDFGNNAGDDIANPDDSTDQNWPPGKGEKRSSKADGILAVRCAEAMIAAGLEPNTPERKYQLAGHYTNFDRDVVLGHVELLERVAHQRAAERQAAVGRTRGAASPVPPGFAQGGTRRVATRRVAAHDPSNDSLLFG